LRDANGSSSAVGRPQSGYYADTIEEAAALFESLSQNHPFIDGYKRTAITATAVFLRLNGYKLLFEDVEAYEWLRSLYETGRVTKAAVAEWLRSHART
jgi:death-on-curing protein